MSLVPCVETIPIAYAEVVVEVAVEVAVEAGEYLIPTTEEALQGQSSFSPGEPVQQNQENQESQESQESQENKSQEPPLPVDGKPDHAQLISSLCKFGNDMCISTHNMKNCMQMLTQDVKKQEQCQVMMGEDLARHNTDICNLKSTMEDLDRKHKEDISNLQKKMDDAISARGGYNIASPTSTNETFMRVKTFVFKKKKTVTLAKLDAIGIKIGKQMNRNNMCVYLLPYVPEMEAANYI